MDDSVVIKEAPDRAAIRAGSQDILDQARWLYGIHTDRSNSAQQRATAMMAFAGGVLALTSAAAPESSSVPQVVAFLITLTLVVATVVLAVSSLVPRPSEGPSVSDLRKQWLNHRQSDGDVEQVHQITESLLRTTATDEKPSFLALAHQDANRRMRRLRWACWALGGSLLALSALIALNALQP